MNLDIRSEDASDVGLLKNVSIYILSIMTNGHQQYLMTKDSHFALVR